MNAYIKERQGIGGNLRMKAKISKGHGEKEDVEGIIQDRERLL